MISIYISYSHPATIVASDIFKPVHAGKENSPFELDIPGDNTGDNISARNFTYCELTTQYWAWKNDRTSEALGFFHYRRFLDLSGRWRVIGPNGFVSHPVIDEGFLDRFGLREDNFRAWLDRHDAILPRPIDLRLYPNKTIRDHYANHPHHFARDLDLAGEVIGELFPQDHRVFLRALAGHTFFPGNMFVFRRALFEDYSRWLFAIMAELERRLDMSGYSGPERRVLGYLGERLLTVYVTKIVDEGKHRVAFAPAVYVRNTTVDFVPPAGAKRVVSWLPFAWAIVPPRFRPRAVPFAVWLKRLLGGGA